MNAKFKKQKIHIKIFTGICHHSLHYMFTYALTYKNKRIEISAGGHRWHGDASIHRDLELN